MAHQSDNAHRLSIRVLEVTGSAVLPHADTSHPKVWLLVMPFGRTISDAESSRDWFKELRDFSSRLHPDSVVTILTSAQDAAETLLNLGDALQFQLWVAVKLTNSRDNASQQLPENHAALLVLSKYRGSLRHTKTRIAYTYCPACDKTTKDYGGKKHTYHEYGTLVSDVWRDITYTPDEEPTAIITRIGDLFGLDGYRDLNVVNLIHVRAIRPTRIKSCSKAVAQEPDQASLSSQLINGDSLAELRKLPDNSVDFCYADPPYNLAKRYDSWDDAIDVRQYLTWCESWVGELARVLRPGRTCAVLNIPILAVRHFQHMKRILTFQSWIVWEGLSLPVRMIMPAHYATVCFSKGVARPLPGLSGQAGAPLDQFALTSLRENYCVRSPCIAMRHRARERDREPINDLWSDIHRLKHNSRRVDHPCQLPPSLMRRLIALFTYPDEMVLDPFNGSGTTTLCAEMMRRRYIGIELSQKYHAIAESRHRSLSAGGDPFEKVGGVPNAKNSRVDRIGGVKYAVPKKTLQLEVRRIAELLGHMPSREELEKHGRYSIRYYDEYFISWGEVCAAARTTGMSETRGARVVIADHHATLFDPSPS